MLSGMNCIVLEDAVESRQEVCTALIGYLNHADTLPPDQLPLEVPFSFTDNRMQVHPCGMAGSFACVN